MSNPLLQMMGGTPSRGMGGMIGLMQMLRSGNPEEIARNLLQQNPQFKAFMEANQGKTPEQVARENGIDLSQFKGLM